MASPPASSSTVVSTAAGMHAFLSTISANSSLSVDLEGFELCRYGTIAIVTVLVQPHNSIWLIDVCTLGEEAFKVAGPDGQTLKSVLADPFIPKFLWDVRNDADALWALYQVDIQGVIDVQLLEVATRTGPKTYVRGLDKCVQFDLRPPIQQSAQFAHIKKQITDLMPTNIFATRPMASNTVEYCANDVRLLPALYDLYVRRIKPDWLAKVKVESARRVADSHSAAYEPRSPNKKFSPWATALSAELGGRFFS